MDVLRRLRGAVVEDCIEGTNVDVDIVKCESDAARQIGRGAENIQKLGNFTMHAQAAKAKG